MCIDPTHLLYVSLLTFMQNKLIAGMKTIVSTLPPKGGVPSLADKRRRQAHWEDDGLMLLEND